MHYTELTNMAVRAEAVRTAPPHAVAPQRRRRLPLRLPGLRRRPRPAAAGAR